MDSLYESIYGEGSFFGMYIAYNDDDIECLKETIIRADLFIIK